VRVTKVFMRHPELFDEETLDLLRRGKHPCDFPGLMMCRTVDESKAINHIRGTAIIIAGSGMCTGGRIKHHLVANIERPESTVLFIGYQAVGTLGRIILEGADRVRIHGQRREVKARTARINGFSAHADRDEIYRWLSSLKRPPRHVFVTHGEPEAAASLSKWLHKETGWSTSVATYEEQATLD
jgi:metallo-beta-lactamase family protein